MVVGRCAAGRTGEVIVAEARSLLFMYIALNAVRLATWVEFEPRSWPIQTLPLYGGAAVVEGGRGGLAASGWVHADEVAEDPEARGGRARRAERPLPGGEAVVADQRVRERAAVRAPRNLASLAAAIRVGSQPGRTSCSGS